MTDAGTDGARAAVGAAVRRFYEELPFNMHGSVEAAAASIEADDLAAAYPDLHALLVGGGVQRVVEVGCGAGWLANTLARHYAVEVEAVDFCASAVERARALAAQLGHEDRASFVRADLFEHRPAALADLVVSLGVLHHTGDCEGALERALSFARPGGCAYVGLYHGPGRRVLLDSFRATLEAEGEAAALARYRALDAHRAGDETLVRSWFRDQIVHPHETQHTLREVAGWLADTPWEVASTSVNGFRPFAGLDEVFALEAGYADRARRALALERRFFPGFFTFLLRHGG